LIAAVILAAGKSERMGYPKALVKLGDRTFLELVLQTVTESGIGQTVIVAGHHFREISEAFPGLPLTFNPDYEKGMGTSVQAGIRALPPGVSGAGIFLVDHPLVQKAPVVALIERLEPGRVVLPIYEGRRGHPVFFAKDLFPEILALTAEQGLNLVVHRDASRVVELPVTDPGILLDVDTPTELDKLLREQK